ncbi:two-component regulator propeller domain-containing protein [Dyadobacter sp. 3J3]|uniref:ligand-binding sensor domain-containing protein n=1 Tax=Dyadobacter sp. 3J3 TaxID=2606600 RepID=UPI001E45A5F2|nr:two-component regulator propeller domain-containing protein [Dyadobacter sp. 3J3]
MTKLVCVCTLLMFVFCISSNGQGKTDQSQNNIKSETKNTSYSYGPDAMVRNVKKGRNGTILFAASSSGVFRYDPKQDVGESFTNLTSEIGSHRFWDVLEDRRGNLWFASTDSGVYYYDRKRTVGKSFQHFTTKDGLVSNIVFKIYEDKAGNIWFATAGGASRFDPNQTVGKSFRNFTTKDGIPNNNITTIMEDKTGKLWFGTRGDACFYDGKTFTVFRNKDGKPFYNVGDIIEDRKGNIWFGGSIVKDRKRTSGKGIILTVEAGLWRFDGTTYTKVSERGASAMIEDKKGNIWTTGSINPPNGAVWALSRYSHNTLYNKKPTVTEIMTIKGPGMLCGILEANDGSIWFGALGAESGVFRYDGKTIRDFKRKKGQK